MLRPPVTSERLALTDDGQVRVALRQPWADGTTHVVFDPVEFLGRLAVLVPRPRVNLILYHGLLGARAAWRGSGDCHAGLRVASSAWPELGRVDDTHGAFGTGERRSTTANPRRVPLAWVGAWRLCCLQTRSCSLSSYGASYITGGRLMEEVIAERARQLGDPFSIQRMMDEINAAGTIPVSLIYWEVTGDDRMIGELEQGRPPPHR